MCVCVSHDLFEYICQIYASIYADFLTLSSLPLPPSVPFMLQKVNDSGMDDGPPSPLPETSIQEPRASGRTVRPEAPVDSMLKDMATIIFSTFLLAGWVAFVITYPKASQTSPPSGLLSTFHYLMLTLHFMC